MPRLALALAAALIFAGGSLAPAAAAPLDPELFAFPGSPVSPGSAAAAATALATRWLGEQPFDNPALEARRGVELSPAVLHVSRQDLRAANRNFDETTAFVDGAGGWI